MKPASDISQMNDGLPMTAAVGRERGAERSRWADLLELTKPRMNVLVVVTTMVGFFMARDSSTTWPLLVHTLLGTAMTAAAASVFNQVFERRLDALMRRTRTRPLPAGRLGTWESLVFGMVLAAGGIVYLTLWVNPLTAMLGAFTLATYIFLYTPLKRITSLCTIVGAIPGAIPPVMGMTAVHGAFSPESLVLFGILFLWQMPHFLAIAILYRDDYKAGGFKMLPCVEEDLVMTSRQIVVYGIALIPITLMPAVLHMAGVVYFAAALVLGLAFLSFGISCSKSRSRRDARMLFVASIVYLPLLLATLMMDKF